MVDPTAWPPVNTLVTLTGPGWPGDAPSRVEDAEGDALLLAAPYEPGAEVPRLLRHVAGSAVCVRWTHARGISELPAEVLDAERGPTPHWRVRATGPTTHIQRRDNVRVLVFLRVEVRRDELTFRATTVDVSEGGMRCILPAADGFTPGERVDVVLEVDGGPVRATAELVRTRETKDGFTEVTARFVGMGRAEAQRVRKFLFAEQVAQRARERDRA